MEERDDSYLDLRADVEVAPFLPILISTCNLCEINNEGTYSDRAFKRIVHAATSTGVRLSSLNNSVLAQKTISAMVEVQPWHTATQSLLPLTDPDQLKRIRF
jgi:hypothetical protein